MDFLQGRGGFRPPVKNFDEFQGGPGPGFAPPNGEMCFNPMNHQLNQMNQFLNPGNPAFLFNPYEMGMPNGLPMDFGRGRGGGVPNMPNGTTFRGGRAGFPGPTMNSGFVNDQPVPVDSAADVMFVFSKHCGRIIGKGGARIREIQDNSGAKIKIHSEEEPVNGQTRVTITGSGEQRMRSKQMIEEVIAENERRFVNNVNVGPGGGMPPVSLPMGGPPPRWNGNSNMPQMQMPQQMQYGQFRAEELPQHQNHMMNQHQQHQQHQPQRNTWYSNGVVQNDGPVAVRGGRGEYEEELSNRFSRLMAEKGTHTNETQPIIKHFYQEDPAVAAMTPDQRAAFCREQNNILVPELENGSSQRYIPNPVATFEQGFTCPDILAQIHRQGFVRPTPIQCMAWPVLLSGIDFIGIAQTGTGKTLAFLLPAFIHIEGQPKPRSQRKGPTVLILSPTRELALQIQAEAENYSYRGIRCLCIYGGSDRRAQMRRLEEGADMVVATPGRLNDLLDSRRINLSEVSYLVLDEADRMLDMGFEPQVVKALLEVRADRQTVMTSATWPPGVQRIARTYMSDPIQVNIGTMDLNACHDVTQRVEFHNEEDKYARLMQFVIEELGPTEKALIFICRKADCNMIASAIQCCEAAPNATCIHGDLDQSQREDALERMRSGQVRVLVATDLASRGLDLKDIAYVFNYDFPRNIEEYVHRVGRTGRAGSKGVSITLMTRTDWRHADELIAIMEEASQFVPHELRAMAERYSRRHEDNPGRGRARGRGGAMRGRRGGAGGGGGGTNGAFPGCFMVPPVAAGGDFGGVFDAQAYASHFDSAW